MISKNKIPKNTKKTAFIFLVLLIVFSFIWACKPTNTETIDISGSEFEDPLTAKQKVLLDLRLDKTADIDDELIPLLQNMFDAESFEFNYSLVESEEDLKYYIGGRDMKVVLPKIYYTANGEPYDVVYLERVREIGYTYCSKQSCEEKDYIAEPADYFDYEIRAPREFLNSLTYAHISEEITIGKHDVYVVDFKAPFGKGDIYLQSYSGLPLKVDYWDNNLQEQIEIEFKDIRFNSVSLFDIRIPSEVSLTDFHGSGQHVTIIGAPLSKAETDNFEQMLADQLGIKYSEAFQIIHNGTDSSEFTKVDESKTKKPQIV
ncbi:hypothetical protein HOK51_07000 [Candidatus Woesearchaeota archaeon]|jgi:hypothetical protein|nr:hypothetical protein [Candidatus Woesearchaeota archaeon]MBT6519570.1 hypothetical protein [Candidatus Woesearchaeota archaeon]MBT7367685.1 hypothetical protein [Candidatus Woesearchaeota archaeon]